MQNVSLRSRLMLLMLGEADFIKRHGFFVKRVVFIRQSFDLQGLFSPFACCNGILFQFKIAGLQLIQSRIRVCDQAAALV